MSLQYWSDYDDSIISGHTLDYSFENSELRISIPGEFLQNFSHRETEIRKPVLHWGGWGGDGEGKEIIISPDCEFPAPIFWLCFQICTLPAHNDSLFCVIAESVFSMYLPRVFGNILRRIPPVCSCKYPHQVKHQDTTINHLRLPDWQRGTPASGLSNSPGWHRQHSEIVTFKLSVLIMLDVSLINLIKCRISGSSLPITPLISIFPVL